MKQLKKRKTNLTGSTRGSKNNIRSNSFFSDEEMEYSKELYEESLYDPDEPDDTEYDYDYPDEESFLEKILRKKKLIIIIAAVVVCIIAALIIVNANKKDIVKGIMQSDVGAAVADIMVGDGYSKNVLDKNFDRTKVAINNGVSTPEGYKTIALFGIDARGDELEAGSRSDSMIIVSFNEENNDVKMASVFRDTYLVDDCNENNEYYIGKANAAYVIGGPALAMSMLNRNWDLAVTDYVVVNFGGLSNIIDAMGGITLEATKEEVKELNYHMKGQIETFGGKYEELKGSGKLKMNGAQATAFCRLRSVQFKNPLDGKIYENDFGRTARQRYALNELFRQAKEGGISAFVKIINEICDNNVGDNKFIMTSLPLDELVKLLSNFMDMNIAGQDAFPKTEYSYMTMLDSGDTIVSNTLEKNMQLMHEFLFNEKGYKGSDDFYKYDSWITRWVNIQKTGSADIMFDPNSPEQETVPIVTVPDEEVYNDTFTYEYISDDNIEQYYEETEYIENTESYDQPESTEPSYTDSEEKTVIPDETYENTESDQEVYTGEEETYPEPTTEYIETDADTSVINEY